MRFDLDQVCGGCAQKELICDGFEDGLVDVFGE